MNIFTQLFCFLLHSEAKTKQRKQAPPAVSIETPAAEKPLSPERAPPSDDDSPPGYKVRWHH